MKKLVLASNNAGKLREFGQLLAPLDFEVVPQAAYNVPEAEEPYATFVENALAKARHCARHTGLPSLADDSGLCVDVLGGAPGVHSARYASLGTTQPKSDARNNAHLIAQLNGKTDRRAHFVAVLVFVRHADDPQPLIAEGEWHGEILDAPRGAEGFGYDPLFFVPALNATAAELGHEQKNNLSHRGVALQQLIAKLQDRLHQA
ncbi:MAG TPA: RdgB/HAM1 family non-canonical purine NTP pyrophosphatase [Roseateles sp.]|jgi:XTP/dITP diphosphohydrolase|nr:RdgB/HAM1 family non-canonical purine NTP pyrophosphatase [Roseateles sp.]HWT53191.1 RdgB/HAM1 family non-canonical purine NTP pyrophosphatase [Rhodocyclaceae bacterium]